MSSMKRKRCDHFSIVVNDNIYVFGGATGDDVVEVWNGKKWGIGPKFRFLNSLSTLNAQAILDRKKRIIITTNYHGIIVYNPIEWSIKMYTHRILRERRVHYAALLQ